MTGLEIAQASGANVVLGEHDRYYWRARTIVLRKSVAEGTGPWANLIAAHEAAHHAQNLAHPWLKWVVLWFEPVFWWAELDAWRRAVIALAS